MKKYLSILLCLALLVTMSLPGYAMADTSSSGRERPVSLPQPENAP